jgi:hypothetical protein
MYDMGLGLYEARAEPLGRRHFPTENSPPMFYESTWVATIGEYFYH